MRKKIAALLVLCLVFCASSAMALAATVEFKAGIYSADTKHTGNVAPIEAVDGKVTLPECAFSPVGTQDEFFGWSVGGMCYYPGETIKVSRDTKVHAIWKSQDVMIIEYRPGRGTTGDTMKARTMLYGGAGSTYQVFGNDSFGFIAPANETFLGWVVVEGQYAPWEMPDYGDSLGWLFARAIAEENDLLQRDDWIVVNSNLVLEAQWSGGGNSGGSNAGTNNGGTNNGGNVGGNNGGNVGGNNGGNVGGNNGGNDAGNSAGNMPETGDSSSMALWLTLMAMAGAAMIMLRKRAHN